MRVLPCPIHKKTHVPYRIELRGKADSYYVVCECGAEVLMGTWFTTLPEFNLEGFMLTSLHESFRHLKNAAEMSRWEPEKPSPKKQRKRKAKKQ